MNGLPVYMPHGMCFAWQPSLLALHIIADATIGIAYFAIAGTLAWFVIKRPDLPFRSIFWMFALFIVSCGTTHFLSIYVIWHPAYWLEGEVKALTAFVSIATAILLVPLIPKALALRAPGELEKLNTALARTLGELHDVVRSYEHEKYIAGSFQSASLADIPSSIGDIRVSAVYRPGSGDLEIGGDWYDAFVLLDGRVVISIGDVTGTGLAASIIMSKVRQAIRVAAQIQVDPARILDAASRSLEIEFPDTIVTAFVGIIDTAENVLQYANAGHPRPVVRNPDATLVELDGASLPLGLRRRGEDHSSHWDLRSGALIVLYTDGLTESTHDYLEGDRRFRSVLLGEGLADAQDPARTIFDAILIEGVRDDVAIMTFRLPDTVMNTSDEQWTFDSGDHERAGEIRRTIGAKLEARGGTFENVFNADMVYSELISNVYRYAPGPVCVRINWRGNTMVLHVLDDGGGFEFLPELPDDPMSERGRGLFIINALVEDFHIQRRRSGGSHARVVLRAPLRQSRSAVMQLA